MNNISELLKGLKDERFKAFHKRLIPNIPEDKIIGVRSPALHALAKELVKNKDYKSFLSELPHEYYDENILHGFIIGELKDYGECIFEAERFLPYVDNWAVCDTMNPKVFKKNKDDLLEHIKIWLESEKTYTLRFGIKMLMDLFLDENFKNEYPKAVAKTESEEYYVKMMQAWYFATALAKHYEDILPFIEEKRLEPWVHNKAIQKAAESYRITKEQKEYLKALKIK